MSRRQSSLGVDRVPTSWATPPVRAESLPDLPTPHDERSATTKSFVEDDAVSARHNLLNNLQGLLPPRYLLDPLRAQPSLDALRAALPAEDSAAAATAAASAKLHREAVTTSSDGPASVLTTTTSQAILKQVSLTRLLAAADQDAMLHTLRKRAVLEKNPALLQQGYSRQTDGTWAQRQARLNALAQHMESLQQDSNAILTQLEQILSDKPPLSRKAITSTSSSTTTTTTTSTTSFNTLTWAEQSRQRLQKWDKAMDLYVYCASAVPWTNQTKTWSSLPVQSLSLTMYQLLDKLVLASTSSSTSATNTTFPELGLTQILTEATNLSENMLQTISQLVHDATFHLMEAQDSFRIRLDAHAFVAHQASLHADQQVHETYLAHGKEAVLIGRALQVSETQLRQCEYATLLLQHWWTLETLAQQQVLNQHVDPIQVVEEVRGLVPMNNCKLDPIFTQPQYSLDAARVLKSLRLIVRQGNSSSSSSSSSRAWKPDNAVKEEDEEEDEKQEEEQEQQDQVTSTTSKQHPMSVLDPKASQRLDLTHSLIVKVSNALEQRLLNTFCEIYTRGGSYDFSTIQVAWKYQLSKPTPSLDWMTLRDVAEALMNFDQGRSLHKRYLSLVISTKFPELFKTHKISNKNSRQDDDDDEDEEEPEENEPEVIGDTPGFDMEEMRTQLAALFHRVSEVCGAEFQLIAHIFSSALPENLEYERRSFQQRNPTRMGKFSMGKSGSSSSCFPENFSLTIARSLIRNIISDPISGMQARIDLLLSMIDKKGGDFDAMAKKLDTFVVIHEKAAGLFSLLREAAMKMWGVDRVKLSDKVEDSSNDKSANFHDHNPVHVQAVASLVQFLNTQEVSLISNHQKDYLNLELRLLHHQCCASLDGAGATFAKFIMLPPKEDMQIRFGGASASKAGVGELQYRAPILPLDKESIMKGSFVGLLNGPLKQSVLRQPLIHAADSLARARLMFGGQASQTVNTVAAKPNNDFDSSARAIVSIFSQMCLFYGHSFLFPIVDCVGKMFSPPPTTPPTLPVEDTAKPFDLGVDPNFWICIERVHTAARTFDRELWAENRPGSSRVWELLTAETKNSFNLALAKDCRVRFFRDLEEKGESAIQSALDTISNHIFWLLVMGGESMSAASGPGGNRQHTVATKGGPYALPPGSLLESANSPAVKALTFSLRALFVQVQSALNPSSLAAFWTALSMKLYDILVARLLQHYLISTVGAVILSRDVEALRSVCLLAGSNHLHWDCLRELLTLYMTPPESIKTLLLGTDNEIHAGKGLFDRVGKNQSLVFLSRRVDYRFKSSHGFKRSAWVVELLVQLNCSDPTDIPLNLGLYTAEKIL